MTNTSQRRLARCFEKAQQSGSDRSKMIVPYITAGDPDTDTTLALMNTLVDAGADIIELGIPFSDPMADGPVVQAACERALAGGTTLNDVLDVVAAFRKINDHTPIVLMGYMNPVETMGYEAFAQKASASGVDGLLTVDLPPEEAADLVAQVDAVGIDSIFLLSPTSPDDRIKAVCEYASGYIYYVSLKGVTGAANLDTVEVSKKVAHIKSITDIPVAVGFGIRDAESAAAVASAADAIVVGSALVSIVEHHANDAATMHEKLRSLVGSMRAAVDKIAS